VWFKSVTPNWQHKDNLSERLPTVPKRQSDARSTFPVRVVRDCLCALDFDDIPLGAAQSSDELACSRGICPHRI